MIFKFLGSPQLIILALAAFVLLPSCVGYKEMILMNAQENKALVENIHSYKIMNEGQLHPFDPYRIQPYDQLVIRINAFEGSTETFINREFAAQSETGNTIQYDPASLYFNSYTVSEEGVIFLPLLDKLEVGGLTLPQLKQMLDEKYKPFLKISSSNVKLANMRVTVLGEVNEPGVHYLYNEKNTLLDAISMAGDVTDFANLKKIKMIRHTDKGTETLFLNLNKPDFVYSAYYFIRPYDVIYIEPMQPKSLDTSSNALGIVLSAISIGVLLANIIIDTSK